MTKIREVFNFSGKSATLWFVIGSVASLSASSVEFLVVMALQLLISTLGFAPKDLGRFSFLSQLDLGIVAVGMILIFIVFLRAVVNFFISFSHKNAAELMNLRCRMLILTKMLRKPYEYIPASTIHTMISEVFPGASHFCMNAFSCVATIIQGISILGILFYLGWRESLVALSGFIVLAFMVHGINKKLGHLSQVLPQQQKHLFKGIQRLANNWLLVRILRTEAKELRQLQEVVLPYSSHAIKTYALSTMSIELAPLFGVVLLVAIIILFQSVFHSPAGNLLGFIYLFIRFVQIVARGVSTASAISIYSPHFKQASTYLDQIDSDKTNSINLEMKRMQAFGHIRSANHSKTLRHSKELKPETGSISSSSKKVPKIRIDSLTFAYPNSNAAIIDHLTLDIPAGSIQGLVGPSGCGKSTLLNLILGILEPSDGKILIDHLDPEACIRKKKLSIGYVGPNPFLLPGNIIDNLSYGLQYTPTKEACDQALKSAEVYDAIYEKPKGLYHRLSENDSSFSAGQQQRLALARALLDHPNILILDEASANLDDVTELEIAKSINKLKGKCTIICASHRPGILKFADNIYYFESKQIPS